MFFTGKNKRRLPLNVSRSNSVIRKVRTHRFLGMTLDSSFRWHTRVTNIIKGTQAQRNTIRRMAGRDWGNSPPSMLSLYTALVVSQFMYRYLYMNLLPTGREPLERLRRNELSVALGVPKST